MLKSILFVLFSFICLYGQNIWSADFTGRSDNQEQNQTTFEAKDSPFKIRGTLPWHNFLSGPTAWNEEDYRIYLDRMKELNLNFIGFHCYSGGAERYATYVEPLIRIEYRNVIPEAGFDTGITTRWGYRPLLLKDYAFGTGKLFPEHLEFFGADCAVNVKDNEDRYEKAQTLMRKVMEMAHQRGIQFALGFEFGVYPPEFASITPRGYNIPGTMLPDPTHPSSVEILQITIDDILKKYPGIDYIWLWLHEHTGFVGDARISGAFKLLYEKYKGLFGDPGNEDIIFTGVWSLEYIRQAYDYISHQAPQVKIIIGGWGGGTQLPAVLSGLDKTLPGSIIFSCLNPGQGWEPQDNLLAAIKKNREVWAIPWLEGDARLWHLQPRVNLLRDQVLLAHEQKLDGVLAIHWRTQEIRLNLESFARFALKPELAPTVEQVYLNDCEQQYGTAAAVQLAPLLVQMDRDQWLNPPESPEYYPYEPQWGRITPELETRLLDLQAKCKTFHSESIGEDQKENLAWLMSQISFTLILDKVGRSMERAYWLKELWFAQNIRSINLQEEIKQSLNELNKAPLQDLFDTFKGRKLSRGELGVLSSVNQKLWLQYKELESFLNYLNHQD